MNKQWGIKVKKELQSSVLRRRENVRRDDHEKLAEMALSLNVRLRLADMPGTQQEHALRFAKSLVDSVPSGGCPSSLALARALKKVFDKLYGPACHCAVGKSFGSFVTHSPGGFVYLSIDSLSFLLFKTEVHLVNEQPIKS